MHPKPSAPDASARAGFGSDEFCERYPRLITVDISGYGDTGDYDTIPPPRATSAPPRAISPAAWRPMPALLEALIERGITGRGKAGWINEVGDVQPKKR